MFRQLVVPQVLTMRLVSVELRVVADRPLTAQLVVEGLTARPRLRLAQKLRGRQRAY